MSVVRGWRLRSIGAAILWLHAAPLHAQPGGYAGVGGFVSPWLAADLSGGSPSLSYENEATDRLVAGLSAEVGFSPVPRVHVGIEAGLPTRGGIAQTHFYFNPFKKDVRYRDTTFFGVVRVGLAAGAVGLDLVAGGGLIHQSSVERTAQGRLSGNGYVFDAFGPEQEVTRWSKGIMGGLDLPLRLGPSANLVPHVRVLYVDRGDVAELPLFPTFGLHDVQVRAGIGLRLAF